GVHLSKAGASRVQENARLFPSARPGRGGRRKRGCGVWQRASQWRRVLLMPPLENDELPEPQRVVAPAREMLVDHAAHECRLEVAALQGRRREERIGEQLAEIPAEPRAERHAEALLATVQDVGRQQRRRDLL